MGSILSILSAAFSALSTFLGLKKTQQDQAAGQAIVKAADAEETSHVQEAELDAVAQHSGDDPAQQLRDGTF